MTTYISYGRPRSASSNIVDRGLRRADRVQALLARTRRRAPGPCTRTITRGDVEAALGDLGDDEVRVVAVGGGDEDVGSLDAGLEQRVDLERGADGERPPASSQERRLARVEALVRRAGPRRGRRPRGRRPAPPWRRRSRRGPRRRSGRTCGGTALATGPAVRRSCSAGLAAVSRPGGAVRITRHGALLTTYLVTSPTKLSRGRPRPPSSAPPRIREGSSAASTIASTPRRRASSTIAWPGAPGADGGRGDLDALVLLPHRLGARAAPRAPARAAPRAAARRSAAPSAPRRPTAPRSSRRRPRAVVVGLLGGQPARRSGRCRRRAACRRSARGSSRTRPRRSSRCSAALGHRHALESATCPASCGRRRRGAARGHPAEPT